MTRLLLIGMLLASCATVPAQPQASETREQAWHRARVVEAMVNGCIASCPSENSLCADEYGLCFSPCAWKRTSKEGKELLRQVALETDPTRSFLITCPEIPGAVETGL